MWQSEACFTADQQPLPQNNSVSAKTPLGCFTDLCGSRHLTYRLRASIIVSHILFYVEYHNLITVSTLFLNFYTFQHFTVQNRIVFVKIANKKALAGFFIGLLFVWYRWIVASWAVINKGIYIWSYVTHSWLDFTLSGLHILFRASRKRHHKNRCTSTYHKNF